MTTTVAPTLANTKLFTMALADPETALALLELLHDEISQMAGENYGLLDREQVSLVFQALFATVRRAGWMTVISHAAE